MTQDRSLLIDDDAAQRSRRDRLGKGASDWRRTGHERKEGDPASDVHAHVFSTDAYECDRNACKANRLS